MTTDSTTTPREELLHATHIRELIRDAAGGFAPDHVARALRSRFFEPTDSQAAEVAELLEGLVATARARLHEAGIAADAATASPAPRLSKRERESADNCAMLLAALCMARQVCGDDDAATHAGHESLAWAELAASPARQAIAWCAIGITHERAGRIAEHEDALAHELAAARASGSTLLVVEALQRSVGLMVAANRHDDAERVDQEMLALLPGSDIPEDRQMQIRAGSCGHMARTLLVRNRIPEAIRNLREALRTIDGAAFPLTRSILLTQLGLMYTEVSQHQQAIECQLEVVKMAGILGSDLVRSYGYLRLAEAHSRLKEYDRAAELLGQAAECAPPRQISLRLNLSNSRATVLMKTNDLDAAAALSQSVLDTIGERPMALVTAQALMIRGEVEQRRGQPELAEAYYRQALARADELYSKRTWRPRVQLAEVLIQQERHTDALALLDQCVGGVDIQPELEARTYRLRAAIAEARNDLRAVVAYEREAFAIERGMLEQQAEQSLRNARVMAQVDLLEREAELERERRRRAERELADAVVALGDRKRLVREVENRLRTVLAHTGTTTERAVNRALTEAVTALRTGTGAQETPLHYLAGVDEDFYQRLRERFPGLTRKQERLCGLLRAGLASKEITTLMELGADGLKALRKRLRKSMGITQDVRLEDVVREI